MGQHLFSVASVSKADCMVFEQIFVVDLLAEMSRWPRMCVCV